MSHLPPADRFRDSGVVQVGHGGPVGACHMVPTALWTSHPWLPVQRTFAAYDDECPAATCAAVGAPFERRAAASGTHPTQTSGSDMGRPPWRKEEEASHHKGVCVISFQGNTPKYCRAAIKYLQGITFPGQHSQGLPTCHILLTGGHISKRHPQCCQLAVNYYKGIPFPGECSSMLPG
jgi:hypothetical protein